jgi:transposase
MDVLHARCCGLDVHKSSITARILVQVAGRVQKHQRRFGAMTQDLQELGNWLRQFEVAQVAMESSGVYWKPVWNILEGQFTRMCRVARPTRKMRNGLRSCCNTVSCGLATYRVKSSAIYET